MPQDNLGADPMTEENPPDPQDEGLTDEERKMLKRSIERNKELLERLAEL